MGPVGSASRRRPTRPQLFVLTGSLVAIVAVGTGLVVQADRGARPAASAGAQAPISTAGGGPASGAPPSGAPSPADWARFEPDAVPLAAVLEPTRQDATGIDPATTFTLTSRTDEPAAALAARLEIVPEATLVVTPSVDGRTAVLAAKGGLTRGGTYRIGLRSPDGTLQGSWAYHVSGPVTVTSTIPGDTTTEVPLRAGVEVVFDQDDVADMASRFTISPSVDGRFERHGRTQVFVPDALKPATLYTVTIGRGLARTGTDLTLEQDVVFRFETEGPGQPAEQRLRFGRDVVEVGPQERPTLGVNAIVPERADGSPGQPPTTAKVVVYRLPSLDAASATLAAFLAAPRWSTYTDPLMPTAGLPVVASFDSNLAPLTDNALVVRFPERLPAGWYIAEIPGKRPTQAFLQVTPISAWIAVLSDRTVVWVNDVSAGRAVRGATVALEGGGFVGRSDGDGLVNAATPSAIVPKAAAEPGAEPAFSPILRVTSPNGASVLVPFGVAGYGDSYRGEWYEKSTPANETYWSMLFTDREVYHQDDTIQVWGYLRGRDDGVVPSSVGVRLMVPGSGRSPGDPVILQVATRPTASGSFTVSLPVAGLPLSAYEVQVVVDGRLVAAHWVEVTVIRKPPYVVAVTPDHLAVLSGQAITWTATATFFDGTPVPGLDLRFGGSSLDPAKTRATNATGKATVSAVLKADDGSEDASSGYVSVMPRGPEAAAIETSTSVVVFPSAYDLDATGVVSKGRLKIVGSLHAIDVAKARRQIAAGTWDGEADGPPVAGQRVNLLITELIPVRRVVGNDYDFVDKVVRPRYEYTIERRPIHSGTLVSEADGRLRFTFMIPTARHEYEVRLETQDRAGRTQRRTVVAGTPFDQLFVRGVAFQETDGRLAGERTYGVGDPIVWRMADDGGRFPSNGPDRYLYIVAQRGLRSLDVTESSTFRRTFGSKDAPGVFVIGVRFTGSTYAPKAATWANFDTSERALRVTVTADRARYRPGETATLSVRTTDAAGRAVAASVLIEAVDEKLFAIGGATVPRPLDDLYGRVDSGIVRLTATHQTPSSTGAEGEGGDTGGGGGDRSAFVDTLVFRQLRTDANGRATTRVKLSDDLTSWHFVAGAITADLRAGTAERLIPVGLPFFVEVTMADSYVVTDRPVIRVRAFGDSLRRGDAVEFTVESAALGLAPVKVKARAFEAASLQLPVLRPGRPSITVTGSGPIGNSNRKRLSDRLTTTFQVVPSRLTSARTAYGVVGGEIPSLAGSTGLTTYTFTDAGRGSVLPLLLGVAERGGMRVDRVVAQTIARRLLIDEFGRSPASLPEIDFDPTQYGLGEEASVGDQQVVTPGIGLLPWSGPDPWLTARMAVMAPGGVQADLRGLLIAIRARDGTKRDLSIAALAGLASVGEPVLADLQAARRQPDLTITERLYLALGLAAAGDDASAIEMERDLLSDHGERFGDWVRLRVEGDPDATAVATALLAVVAGSVGDPSGARMAAYVESNPGTESVHELELAAYAQRILRRTPAMATSFAYVVDGHRTVVALDAGESLSLTLTDAQRAALGLEAISGKVGVSVAGRGVADASSLSPSRDLALTRTATAEPIPIDEIVVVNLTATFKSGAPAGCYVVVEQAPSGLAPMAGGPVADDEEGAPPREDVTWPMTVVGQEVRFCADNDPARHGTVHLRYRARVVNGGRYAWEPAVMQLPGAPELVAITPGRMVEIGKS